MEEKSKIDFSIRYKEILEVEKDMAEKNSLGKLYIVPTPVGNMEDMTFRAVRILKEVDLILAEDTRTSSVLMKHYDIGTPMQSHHKFNEHQKTQGVIEKLQCGCKIALISDAGTPGISDPGFFLVRACREAGIDVECLPGATACIPALVDSSLPADRFCFEGFLPVKKGRMTRLEQLSQETRTFIIYESPYRLVKTLNQLREVLGGTRRACVCREISKVHEESRLDTLDCLIEWYSQNEPKGEIVIVVEGRGRYVEQEED